MVVYLDKEDTGLKYKKGGESLEQKERILSSDSIIKEDIK